jgi:hypothetical protein
MRGPAGPGRQLLFEGAGVELDLHVASRSEDFPGCLTGQVLLTPEVSSAMDTRRTRADLRIQVTDDAGRDAITVTDGFGVFSLTGDWRTPLIVTMQDGESVHEAFIPSTAPDDYD